MRGRPTKYTPELLARAHAYLNGEWDDGVDVVPSHVALFLFLDISRSNGYDWATHDDKQEFSDILDKCMAMQQKILVSKGLSNDFNSAITKLMLGKHGIHEKSEQDITSNGKEIKNNFTIVPVTTKKVEE